MIQETEILDHTDLQKIEPHLEPPMVPVTVKLSKSERNRLIKQAKQAGMQVLNIRELEAVAELGKFVTQLGLFHIEAAKLICSQADIDLIYAKSVQLDKEFTGNHELQMRILEVQDSLMAKRLEAIKIGLKAGEENKPRNGYANGGNPVIPFPPNVAVQINMAEKSK